MSTTIFHFVAERVDENLKLRGITSGILVPRSWPGAPGFFPELRGQICAYAGWPDDKSFVLRTLAPIHTITGNE